MVSVDSLSRIHEQQRQLPEQQYLSELETETIRDCSNLFSNFNYQNFRWYCSRSISLYSLWKPPFTRPKGRFQTGHFVAGSFDQLSVEIHSNTISDHFYSQNCLVIKVVQFPLYKNPKKGIIVINQYIDHQIVKATS